MGKVPRHSGGYSWGNRVYGNNYFMWSNRGKGTRTAGNLRKRLPFLWEPAVEIAVRVQWRTQDFIWGYKFNSDLPGWELSHLLSCPLRHNAWQFFGVSVALYPLRTPLFA